MNKSDIQYLFDYVRDLQRQVNQLSGGIRLLRENQCVLKSVGPGADHVPRHREILTDVEVELNAVGPLGIVGDGVGVTGHLLAAAGL